MKLYKVEFESVFPVGNCLIIIAESKKSAEKIAEQTIVHTGEFEVIEIPMVKEGVVVYLSGNY